jgi:predicted signal transduction protein with EAL and GGDEF domain
MVESMNQVAHALGKQTIAECVENEETLLILKQMGVDRAQGNYIGRPREALMSSYYPGRHPIGDGIIRDSRGHNRPRTNDCTLSYLRAIQRHHAKTQPGIIANDNVTL